MKKTRFAFAVLALAALASCQQNEISVDSLAKSDVGFYLRGSMETKANTGMVTSIKGETFELGTTESGQNFILEETITNLNAIAPETKGTPAYTENVVALYGGKFSVAVENGSGDIFDKGGEFVYDSSKKLYIRQYDGNMWKDSPITFYMWMPGALNTAVTNGINGLLFADGTISFDYDGSKLTTADKMQDLIFSARSFSGVGTEDTEYNEETGAEVLFHHALTGVKFAVNPNSVSGVTITNVTISGLKDKGHCVITPRPEEETGYKDNKTADYSSSDGLTVVWSGWDAASPAVSYSLGNYNGTTVNYNENGGQFGSNTENIYPASFAAGGSNVNNLNDSEATFTFWFVPQEITDAVNLTISYTETGSTTVQTWDIPIGEYLVAKNVVWKAGELRTYFIKVDDVKVTITDQFTKSVKNNVQITNTGNTDAYIRAAIIGQWVDEEEKPVFGYTDFKTGEIVIIESWYEDYINAGKYFGTFSGLAGYAAGTGNENPTGAKTFNGWTLETDGFYYYETPVAPGESPNKLFTSYTVNDANIPTMAVGGREVDAQLLIEISTQAVSAKKADGSNYTRAEAWANAKTKAQQ